MHRTEAYCPKMIAFPQIQGCNDRSNFIEKPFFFIAGG
jgi:hypothetical protein